MVESSVSIALTPVSQVEKGGGGLMGLIVMNLGSPFFRDRASVTRCMKARAICVLMKAKRQYSKVSIISPMAVSTLHAMEKGPLIQRIKPVVREKADVAQK